mgnify:FL=1
MFPRGRKLLLGVSGGISAYKSCDLLRRLQDHGFIVDVVPTAASLNFVGKSTWEALSGRKVITDLWSDVENVPHISMAKANDLIVIAPATADLIAKLASGRADDLLTNIVLASTAPKILIPAMHTEMWLNAATVANVEILRNRGFVVINPDEGRMTGSDVGVGRFPESGRIITEIDKVIAQTADLVGKKILITAGGTREPIDPIRFIGNRSSGRQGSAVARAARDRGAQVKIILANSQLSSQEVQELNGIEVISVETATQMHAALEKEFPAANLLVMSAAVADARPSQISDEKIKKGQLKDIQLVENPDLLKSIASMRDKQVIIAFAAETNSDIGAAQEKMKAKGANILYLNNVSGGAIFGSDSTEGFILTSNGAHIPVSQTSKDTLAELLLDQALIQLG